MSDEFNRGISFHRQGDYQQAVYWYKKGAEKGNAQAQVNLGLYYQESEGDFKQAECWYTKAAEQGDAVAQNLLGTLYAKKEYGLYDRTKAKYWLSKAAIQGNEEASDYLGAIVEFEEAEAEYKGTVDVNTEARFEEAVNFLMNNQYNEAIPLLTALAHEGHAKAQYNLGLCYANAKRDYAEAVKWWYKASEQGHADAIQILMNAKQQGLI